MALIAKYHSMYTSKNGTPTCRYTVEGTTAELKAYKKVQGDYHRVQKPSEGGKHLWFTTRYVGDVAELIITESGNVIANQEEFNKQKMLVEQAGGNLGQELAKAFAEKMVSSAGKSSNVSTSEGVSSNSGLGEG